MYSSLFPRSEQVQKVAFGTKRSQVQILSPRFSCSDEPFGQQVEGLFLFRNRRANATSLFDPLAIESWVECSTRTACDSAPETGPAWGALISPGSPPSSKSGRSWSRLPPPWGALSGHRPGVRSGFLLILDDHSSPSRFAVQTRLRSPSPGPRPATGPNVPSPIESISCSACPFGAKALQRRMRGRGVETRRHSLVPELRRELELTRPPLEPHPPPSTQTPGDWPTLPPTTPIPRHKSHPTSIPDRLNMGRAPFGTAVPPVQLSSQNLLIHSDFLRKFSLPNCRRAEANVSF